MEEYICGKWEIALELTKYTKLGSFLLLSTGMERLSAEEKMEVLLSLILKQKAFQKLLM